MRRNDVPGLLCLLAILAYALPLHFAGVSRQLLGGDEFHTLRAAEMGFWEIFTHYGPQDNSIPLTLYARVLMKTVGLTEMGLRWPVMVTDVLLLLAPLLLLRRLGWPVVLTTIALIAGSPFVVYYSIVGRPYTPAAFLMLLSLVSWCRWLETRSNAALWSFALSSAFAVFMHLLCAAPVATLLILTGAEWWSRKITRGEFVRAVALFAGVTLLLMGPGLPELVDHRLNKVGTQVRFKLTAQGSYWLSVGHLPAAGLALPVLLGVGSWSLWRRVPRLGRAATLVIVAQCAALFVLRPQGAVGTFARYFYVVWPIVMILVSSGLEALVVAGSTGFARARRTSPPDGARAVLVTALGLAAALAIPMASPARLFRSGPTSLRSQKLILDEMTSIPDEELPAVLRAVTEDTGASDVVLLSPTLLRSVPQEYLTTVLLSKRLKLAGPLTATRRSLGMRLCHEVPADRVEELRATGAKYLIANPKGDRQGLCRFFAEQFGEAVAGDDNNLLFVVNP